MVEQGGKAKRGIKSPEESSFKLRFNVEDLEAALAEIRAWGRTINISDPDGNRVGIQDESGFVRQVSRRY